MTSDKGALTGHRSGYAPQDAVTLRSVCKTFGSHLALDSLDLTIKVGEIHALVAERFREVDCGEVARRLPRAGQGL